MISNYRVRKDEKGWNTARKEFTGLEFELYKNNIVVFAVRKNVKNGVMLDEFEGSD
jgi:hypothetical protein